MGLLKLITGYFKAFRAFAAPRYHPERHYMRGPGPACARRNDGDPSARTRDVQGQGLRPTGSLGAEPGS